MTTDQPILRQRSLPDEIRYFSRKLIDLAVSADDMELGAIGMALGMTADRAEKDLAEVVRRADAAETDRARLANIVCGLLALREAMPEGLRDAVDRVVQGNGGHPCEERIAELTREVADLETALGVPA